MNTATHNMHSPSPQDGLSPERPWPGLAAYTEADRAYFFGRDAEAEDLTRRIRRERLTVLFGQSGLGKTSLLKAGLFPRLRAADLQPIYLRLDYTAQARPLGEQVLAAISAAIQREALDAPLPQAGEGLWAYFHRRDLEWWSPRNRLLTPVLVFDQFEEIFTLGRSHLQASQTFLDELADLIENRAPEQAPGQPPTEGQDNSRVFGKLLLSFREDFLPDFEALKGRIHSLFLNRVRLERLSGEAACSVLQESGGHLLAAGLAQDIVRFVAAEKKPRPLSELTVEPALLSVVCRELNERRISRHAERIGADMLELGQHEILRDLVGRALTDQPAALVEELEEHLLTDGGHRAQYPLQDLIQRAGVGPEAIYALVTQRILRVEPRGEVEWVELTHDLLAPVVRENRDRRRAALELERNRRKMRRIWAFAGAMVVLVVGMSWLVWDATQSRHSVEIQAKAALVAESKAVAAQLRAEAAQTHADAETENAKRSLASEISLRKRAEILEKFAQSEKEVQRRLRNESEEHLKRVRTFTSQIKELSPRLQRAVEDAGTPPSIRSVLRYSLKKLYESIGETKPQDELVPYQSGGYLYKGTKYTVLEEVRRQYPELVQLILGTDSMDERQKQDWFDLLPGMNQVQTDRLAGILETERRKLEDLEMRYQDEIKQLDKHHLGEWQQLQLEGFIKNKTFTAKEAESVIDVMLTAQGKGQLEKEKALALTEFIEKGLKDSAKIEPDSYKQFKRVVDIEAELAASSVDKLTITLRKLDVSRQALANGLASAREVSGNLLSASWYFLILKRPVEAEQFSVEGLRLTPNYLALETNLAHAKALEGQTSNAMDVYSRNIGRWVIQENGRDLWEKAVSDDFEQLREAGVTSPVFDQAVSLFKSNMLRN